MKESKETPAFKEVVSLLDAVRESAKEAYALPYFMLRAIQRRHSSILEVDATPLTKTNVYGVGGLLEEITVHGHTTFTGGTISDYLLLFSRENNFPLWMKELLTNVAVLFKGIDPREDNKVLVQIRLTLEGATSGNYKVVRSKVIIGDYELGFGRHMSSSNSRIYNDCLWGQPWIQVSHVQCKQDQALVFLHKVLMLHRSGNILSAISDKYGIIPEEERELIKFIDPRAKILLDKEPDGFTIINSTDTLPETFTIRNRSNALYVI